MTILFAGGGSGGHLYPGVAVAEELMNRDASFRCLFAGSERTIEKQVLTPFGFEHFSLPVSSSAGLLKSPISAALGNWRAYQAAHKYLRETTPSVVVGLGGFASVPVVIAAWRRRIPVVLLEQNAVLGRANRVLLPFATGLSLSFANTPVPSRYHKIARFTGNPVRREVRNISEIVPHHAAEPSCLLILGGSQGASGVNEAFVKALPRLNTELLGWRIVHQTGSHDFDRVKQEYIRMGIAARVVPFLTEMGSIYPQSTMAISRAGATTLAELAIHGIPSILIPYPRSIRNHQMRNAEHFARVGGAVVVPQSENSESTAIQLCEQLRLLITRTDLQEPMRAGMLSLAHPEAASFVADLLGKNCLEKQRAA